MPDPNAIALGAVAGRSAWAFPLVYAVGVLSSTGPCAAPRVLAFSSFMLRAKNPGRTALAFLSGSLLTYGLLGFVGGLVASLVGIAPWIYGTIAAAAIVGGIWTIVDASWCSHDLELREKSDVLGAVFLSGAGFSLVVSPCCTPLIGVIVAYASGSGGSLIAALLLVCFGLGHASPVFTTVMFGRPLGRWLADSRLSQGATVVAGASMIALGGYYALLV